VGWSGLAGEVVGCSVAIGALVWFHRAREKLKEERAERAPQSEKILRPAGYSAMKKVDEAWEGAEWALAQMVGGAVIGGLAWGSVFPVVWAVALGRVTVAQVAGVPQAWSILVSFFLGMIGALWGIREFRVIGRLYEDARNWRLGLRGEQAVAEKLADRSLAAAGYVVFHDLPAERAETKWNVDHVVVGPGGIFVLETKARAKRRATRDQEESKVIFDGEKLQFPWCVDWGAVNQVQRNAEWVGQLIKEYAPEGIAIQPVIVVPGWYVESMGNYPVKAMNAKYLVGYLAGMKPVYEARELKGVVKRLDEVCRGLEF